MANPVFIADVHLGKLAKALRLLGFDTLYSNAFSPAQLCSLAAAENRVLLSRGAAFGKGAHFQSLVIQSENPEEQIIQVIQQLGLHDKLHPFTRCLVCNGLLHSVPKEKITSQLQENTARYFNEFWQCADCSRIYWKGSHYDRMLRLVEKIEQLHN